jgi:hypothetical protein
MEEDVDEDDRLGPDVFRWMGAMTDFGLPFKAVNQINCVCE